METVHVREELDAPLEKVWLAIRDFGDIRAWAPAGKVLAVEGEGVGSVRRVDSPGGLFVERLVGLDDAAHRFSYAVLESPAPFRDYVAFVQLTALGDERCAIEWSCEYGIDPEAAEAMRGAIEGTYRDGFIASLRQTLSA